MARIGRSQPVPGPFRRGEFPNLGAPILTPAAPIAFGNDRVRQYELSAAQRAAGALAQRVPRSRLSRPVWVLAPPPVDVTVDVHTVAVTMSRREPRRFPLQGWGGDLARETGQPATWGLALTARRLGPQPPMVVDPQPWLKAQTSILVWLAAIADRQRAQVMAAPHPQHISPVGGARGPPPTVWPPVVIFGPIFRPILAKLAAVKTRDTFVRRAPHSILRPPVPTPPKPPEHVYVRVIQTRQELARRAPHSKLRPPAVVFANVTPPELVGVCDVGEAIATTDGTWSAPVTITYQWQSSPDGSTWTDVPGATTSVFDVTSAYAGLYLRCAVTATPAGGSPLTVYTDSCLVASPPVVRSTANTLGCGEYAAYVFERGGQAFVGELPWTTLTFSRTLDDTSQATVEGIMGQDADCAALIDETWPWQHELVIFRNGSVVWVGPVYQVTAPPGSFRIEARDLTAWWDHRLVHSSHNYTGADLATIFQAFADDAMSPDDSPNLTVTTTPSGVKGSRKILAAQHQLAGPALRDLSETGIDWTAVARTVLAGGRVVPTDPLRTFTDGDFVTPPTPVRDGSVQANREVVRGAGGGEAGDTVFGEDSDNEGRIRDGLLESVDTVSTITDNTAAKAQATSRLDLTKRVVTVQSCDLAPDAPYPFSTLIPGALCPLNLQETGIPVVGDYRLVTVTVNVQSGSVDTVTVVFQPKGTE